MRSDTKRWRERSQQTFRWLVTDVRQRREKHVAMTLQHLPHHSGTWSSHPASERRSLEREDVTEFRDAETENTELGCVNAGVCGVTKAFVEDVFGGFAQIREGRRDGHCTCRQTSKLVEVFTTALYKYTLKTCRHEFHSGY